LAIAEQQANHLQEWRVDFSEVSLVNPVSSGDRESGLTTEQARQAERFRAQRDGQAAAMMVVKELHLASNAENAINSESLTRILPSSHADLAPHCAAPFPDAILEQMRSCHNAATEFLRQYWSAVLPTPTGALGAGSNTTTAASKAAKAEKMARYLRSTDSKVNAVVHTATIAGFDPARVRAVRLPLLPCAVPLESPRHRKLIDARLSRRRSGQ
jgi:transcription initiation factor TFIIH subunit 1